MNVEDFIDLWKNSKDDLKDEEAFWDSRADEFNKKDILNEERVQFKEIINFLGKDINSNCFKNVLDIGCGPGVFSGKFSEISEKVTGVDISQNMINYAKQNAEKHKRKNVSFFKESWNELDLEKMKWEKKFDLVFASMSPAVNGYEHLIKMIKCSKDLCFLSAFVKKEDEIKNKLSMEVLGIPNKNPHENKVYSVFNILWNLGYLPKITYKSSSWCKENTEKEIINYYLEYFGRKTNLSVNQENIIKDIISSYSNNGMIIEKVNAQIAWICWEVHKLTGR